MLRLDLLKVFGNFLHFSIHQSWSPLRSIGFTTDVEVLIAIS
jgi:hypothetical protein